MGHKGFKIAVAAAFGAALVAIGVSAATAASTAMTMSQITSPKNHAYFLNHHTTGDQSFTISGTSNGTTGDAVDIKCYDNGDYENVVGNIAVAANGSFTTSAPLTTVQYHACILRAIPHGVTPNDLTPYAGPTIAVSHAGAVVDGNLAYDYYDWGQQFKGAFDYYSLSSCGIDDGYLFDATPDRTTTTYYCNAYLHDGNADVPTRSEIQVDGANAYGPEEAHRINPAATGLVPVPVSRKFDPKTGNLVIHETDPILKCTDSTYPPTNLTCTSFVGTGVTDHRTIMQTNDGLVSWITDVFTSTNKKPHSLDLLWQNDNHFQSGNTGDATQIEYEFPGQTSYALSTLNENITLPKKPGTIRLRVSGSSDGDTATGRGEIVYDTPASNAVFAYENSDFSTFELHQKLAIPAGGSKRTRFAYVQAYQQKTVDKLAKGASVVFAGCTVPNVVGKSLAAAKKAVKAAHCSVGRTTATASSTIAKGVVVAETPAAGTHVDYGAKISLIVSKG